MNKKTFKDNTANIDRFFTKADTPNTESTESTAETHDTHSTQNTLNTTETHEQRKTFYRINLKLRPEFRQYLDDESWKARKSITEYINDLIQSDKDSKEQNNGNDK